MERETGKLLNQAGQKVNVLVSVCDNEGDCNRSLFV